MARVWYNAIVQSKVPGIGQVLTGSVGSCGDAAAYRNGEDMKKQVTRIIGTAAIICMTGSMAACGDSASKALTAEELFQKAIEETQDRVEMQVTGTTKTMGISMDTDCNVKTIKTDDSIELAMTGKFAMMEMSAYYVDGWMYMDMGELGKMKTQIDASDSTTLLGQLGVDQNALAQIDPTDCSELTLSKDDDGNHVVSYTVPADKVSAVVDAAGSAMNALTEDMELSYEDMTGTLVFDQNNELIKQTQHIKMTMNVEGTTMDTETDTVSTILATGDDVKITYPDFDDFEEIDASDLGLGE